MGFGEGLINLHLIFQYDCPMFYSSTENKFRVNSKQLLKTRFWHTPIWSFTKYGVFATLCYCIQYLYCFGQRKHISDNVSEVEVLTYCVTLGITSQAFVTVFVAQKDPTVGCNLINAVFKLTNAKHFGLPTSQRLPDLQECIAYCISFGGLLLPLTFAGIPLMFDFDPINAQLQQCVPDIPRRLFASLAYGSLGYFATEFCVLTILHCVAFAHCIEILTLENLNLSRLRSTQRSASFFENVVKKLVKSLLCTLELFYPSWRLKQKFGFKEDCMKVNRCHLKNCHPRFQHCRKMHFQLQVLTECGNMQMNWFVPTMTLVGVYLCTLCNYFIITYRNSGDFNIQLLIACDIPFNIAIYWIILFLSNHASLPGMYSYELLSIWKRDALSQVERKQVVAMNSFGLRMGPFFQMTKVTALDLIGFTLSYTTTLLVNRKQF